jgi:hypothetical protein
MPQNAFLLLSLSMLVLLPCTLSNYDSIISPDGRIIYLSHPYGQFTSLPKLRPQDIDATNMLTVTGEPRALAEFRAQELDRIVHQEQQQAVLEATEAMKRKVEVAAGESMKEQPQQNEKTAVGINPTEELKQKITDAINQSFKQNMDAYMKANGISTPLSPSPKNDEEDSISKAASHPGPTPTSNHHKDTATSLGEKDRESMTTAKVEPRGNSTSKSMVSATGSVSVKQKETGSASQGPESSGVLCSYNELLLAVAIALSLIGM